MNPHTDRTGWSSAVALVVVSVVFVVPSCGAIDVDPIAERTDLPEVCRVEGKSLTTVGPGNHALVGEAGRLAVVGDSRQNQWLLRPTECALQEFKRPSTTGSEYLEFVALTNAAEIVVAVIAGDRPVRYVLLDVSTGTMTVSRMPQPEEGTPNFPRVSSDGRWAAWLARPNTENEELQGGPVGKLEAEFAFSPSARLGADTYDVIDVAPGGQEILLQKSLGEYLLVDPTGSLIWTFRPDDGVLSSVESIRLSRDRHRYLAWDSYREQGAHVVQWRVNDRLVRKELPPDSTVGSAAVSSDWRWIAVSANANTKAGRGVESVTVWSSDGTVRFHTRLRDGARTPVMFLGDNLFAYNDVDQKWQFATRVLRLSEPHEK